MPASNPRKDRPNARFHGRVEAPGRLCAEPGCTEPGEFRAPPLEGSGRAADGPPPFSWLCLDHVRAFNSGYNFFKGMSPEEINDAQRPFAGWEREIGSLEVGKRADLVVFDRELRVRSTYLDGRRVVAVQ